MDKRVRERHMKISTWLTAAWVAVLNAMGGPPPGAVRDMSWCIMFLMTADMLTAIWAAGLTGTITSKNMTRGLLAKMVQYFGMGCITLAVGAMMNSWIPFQAVLSVIMFIETNSIFENLCKLEKVGVNMGPFRNIVSRIGRYLVAGANGGQDEPVEQIEDDRRSVRRSRGR